MKNKWVCNKCGHTIFEKPSKNQICNLDDCKGRFLKHTQCDCGKWYVNSGSDKKYCSMNCASRDRGHVTLKCTYCGSEFFRYKGDVKGRKAFCNIDCLRAYEATRKVQRICLQCGKTFEVFKSAIEHTNASGNYCSRECYDKFLGAQEHGKYYRGDFDRVKKEHFAGVQFCAVCGTTKDIHIHHIIPYRFTQDNGVDNLIPLCRRHHKMIEETWLHFINLMDDKETAKKYVNISLRSMHQQTGSILWKLKNLKLSTSN